MGYYRKFVENYSRRVAPLMKPFQKDTSSWTQEET